MTGQPPFGKLSLGALSPPQKCFSWDSVLGPLTPSHLCPSCSLLQRADLHGSHQSPSTHGEAGKRLEEGSEVRDSFSWFSLQVKELNLSLHFLICKVRLMLVFTSKGAVLRIKWGNLCKACSMGSSSQEELKNLGHCPWGRTVKSIQCLYHLQEEDGRAER